MKAILLFSLFKKILYFHLAFSVIPICYISGHFPGLGQGFVSKNKTIWIYTSESEKKPQSFNDSISSVQSLSRVRLFATPWIAAYQASLSITKSQSSPKLLSIELVMPSSHLILCCPLLLLPPIPPSIRVIPMSQLFAWGGQSTGISALASVLPKNTSEWTGWISLQSKGFSRVFSNTTLQKHQFFGVQLSSQSKFHIHTWPLEKP